MNFKPLYDQMLIKSIDEETTSSGIIIRNKARENSVKGQVLAVGDGRLSDTGKDIPLKVKVGDIIVFNPLSVLDIILDGKEYCLIKEDYVLGVIGGC